jgi:hypothetical protein
MVLHGHDPTLHITINIPLPNSTHVNQVNLSTITKLGRYDGLRSTLALWLGVVLGVTYRAVAHPQVAKLHGAAVGVVHARVDQKLVKRNI